MSTPSSSAHQVNSALRFKELGNRAYRNNDCIKAALYYTQGITIFPPDSDTDTVRYQLHLNRSKAFFYINEYAYSYAELFCMLNTQLKEALHYSFALKVAAKIGEVETFNSLKQQMHRYFNNIHSKFTEEDREEVYKTLKTAEETLLLESKTNNNEIDEKHGNSQLNKYKSLFKHRSTYKPNIQLIQQMYPTQIDSVQFRISTLNVDIFRAAAQMEMANILSIKECSDRSRGLGIFTNRGIQQGETFLIQSPIVYISVHENECEHCGKPTNDFRFKHCRNNNCNQAKYCTEECEKMAWEQYHGVMCQKSWKYTELKKECLEHGCTPVSRILPMIMKLMAKSMQLNLLNPLHMTQMAQLAPNTVFLNSHIPLSVRMSQYLKLVAAMNWKENDRKRMDLPTFDYLYAILLNYVFQVYESNDRNKVPSALGLYQYPSFLNHSCSPNAEYRIVHLNTTAPRIQFTATKFIPRDTEVCISYIDNSDGTTCLQRRNSLQQYGFTCECLRCQLAFV